MSRGKQGTVVDEIYQQVVERLPIADRLALAQRILRDLEARLRVDESDAWAEEDIRDIAAYSLRYSEQALGEQEETP